MKMKIFKVFQKKPAYDEDQEMIILANSLEEAKKIAYENWQFRSDIKELFIEEISLHKSKIVCICHYGE